MTAQVIIAGVVLLLIEFIGLWYLYAYAVIPADRMETAFWVFQISTFTMILNIINVPFHGAIMAHEKMGCFCFLFHYRCSDETCHLLCPICYLF